MINELQTNIEEIYDEVMTKLIPGNIKKDVTILNVTGVLEEGRYRHFRCDSGRR